MSRPFRTLFILSLAASSLGLAGCGTIYTPVYSNNNLHYKAPVVATDNTGKPQKTAAEILKESDEQAQKNAAQQNADPSVVGGGALMPPTATPPAADAIPGMTPAPATPPATPPAN